MKARRLFVGLSLAFLLLWPPVQHGLHRELRVSPWRLFGLGVYARPKLDLSLEVEADGEPVELRTITDETHDALVALLGRTRELGMLADPRPAGCQVARDRDASSITILRFEHDLGADGWVHVHEDEWTVNRRHCPDARP